jgi:transposase InsO family protein
MYLAVVIDLFSRRIVGWSMKTSIDRSLVIDAVEMACWQRRPQPGKTIFHSDRGSVYASDDYRVVLEKYDLTASMSRCANRRRSVVDHEGQERFNHDSCMGLLAHSAS